MKRIAFIAFIVICLFSLTAAASLSPKREFRAVWLSTVSNIDWPVSRYDSDVKKQNDLRNYLIKLKDSGCNAVLFQVRCSCDAMYKSEIEPWSYWFSGEQGKGPVTDWDPLAFAVEEAHKLGLELHTWVNPYRAVVAPNSTNLNNSDYIDESHITKTHPEWILKFSDVHILDPGLPEVRTYIRDVLMDIVTRYDIDGLHMDDYFYPYSGITNEDTATFDLDPRGFENIHDWRRDNINLLVQSVMDSINIAKPWVKWGISPFGIYKPGIPDGISGLNAYDVLYCDPLAWLEDRSIDYLTPQVYWPFDGGQDYGKLIPWWAQQCAANERHFYPGQAMYRAKDDNFPRGEIPRQIRLNRSTDNCGGSVFFTANDFYDNHKNTIDSLKLDLYRYPALWPVMDWKDSVPPAAPRGLQLLVDAEGNKSLSWDAPVYSDPSDSAYAYVVYRAPYVPENLEDMSMVKSIDLSATPGFDDNQPGMYYYMVTALDRNKLESVPGSIDYPFTDPLQPQYAALDVPKIVGFRWRPFSGAAEYIVELSSSADFLSVLLQTTLSDTMLDLELEYDTQYFWRVKADNAEQWSPVWSFATEPPPPVQILEPQPFAEGCSTDPRFRWRPYQDAISYDIQVAENADMSSLIADQSGIQDTAWMLHGLENMRTYYWRIRSNKYENWNEVLSFKTKSEHIETLWKFAGINSASGLASGMVDGGPLLIALSGSGENINSTLMDPYSGMSYDYILNLDGVSGGSHILRDIEISDDGLIYAANCANPGETFKIYEWTNPAQPPKLVYQAENIAYRLGDHISVKGRKDDGSISLYAPGAGSSKMMIMEWNGVSQSFEGRQLRLQRVNGDLPSVAFIPDSDEFLINSMGENMQHLSALGMMRSWTNDNPDVPLSLHALSSFAYNGKLFTAAYTSETESAHIYDISDGLREIRTCGSTYRLGINENPEQLGDVEVLDNGDGSFLILVLGANNGLAVFSFDAEGLLSVTEPVLAEDFKLGDNYPNPFNPVTNIPYSLEEAGEIEVSVFDLSGRLVRTLYRGSQAAGRHSIRFDAGNLSSGVYICRLRAGQKILTRKMTLLK